MTTPSAVRWKLPSLDGRSAAVDNGLLDVADTAAQQDEAVAPEPVDAPSMFDVVAAEDTAVPSATSDDAPAEPGSNLSAGAEENTAVDAERKAARDAGYAEGLAAGRIDGHAEGLVQGREAALAEHASAQTSLGALLAYFAKPLADLDESLENELVGLSMAIARQLVRRELQTAPGEIVPVVREALALLPSKQREVSVRLHPDDAVLVREALSGLAEADAYTLVEDPVFSRGGCEVQGGHSHVDASLESRLNAVATALVSRSRSDD